MAKKSIKDFLASKTCKDCMGSNIHTPITVSSDLPVTEACKTLADNGISSAPVMDTFDHALKGSFDYRDFSAMLVRSFENENRSFGSFLKPDVELNELITQGRAASAPVALVTDYSHKNPLAFVKESDSLDDVVSHFLSSLHRVCVVDASGTFIGVLSQSDIIKFLYANSDKFSFTEWDTSVTQLDIVNKEVVSLEWSHSVMEALCLMDSKDASSLALVDEEGNLASVFSMTDIKYLLRSKNYEALEFSCHDYISSVRSAQALEHNVGNDSYPFFGVQPDASFKRALGKLVATRSHRLFVVDPEHKPIGVISMTDILQKLVQK